jgi:hypothetical protein
MLKSSLYEPLNGTIDGANISEILQELISTNAEIQKALGRIGSSRDSVAFRDRTHQDVERATSLAASLGKQLKTYSGKNRDKILQAFSREFRSLQNVTKELAVKERRVTLAGPHKSVSDLQSALFPETAVGLQQEKGEDLVPMEELLVEVDEQKHREESLKHIENDVRILADLMKDMAFLVEEQQDFVDSIENHTVSAASSTYKAEGELRIVSVFPFLF